MNKNFFIDEINLLQVRKDLTNPKVGDNYEVITKIFDKSGKSKPSSFKGTVISSEREASIDRCFTIVDHSGTMIIEKKFFTNSPMIIEIKRIGTAVKNVRRAKLYYHKRKLAERKRNS